jgi:putative FmdB family regulatory protein
MPTYEYACQSCGTHVEVYQRFNEDPLTVCGVCGGPLRKVFHPAGILFKGSGFYATDSRTSRSKSSGDGASEAPSAAEKAGGHEDGSSKDKSAAKKESGAAATGAKESA